MPTQTRSPKPARGSSATEMRAARLYGVGDLRIETIPEPASPTGADVLIKVLAAGICGSDLHNFKTGQWLSRVPSTPGHELVGEILAVGTEVRKLKTGDHVVADSRVACGMCPACRRGSPNLCQKLGFVGEVCDGGFAEMTRASGIDCPLGRSASAAGRRSDGRAVGGRSPCRQSSRPRTWRADPHRRRRPDRRTCRDRSRARGLWSAFHRRS